MKTQACAVNRQLAGSKRLLTAAAAILIALGGVPGAYGQQGESDERIVEVIVVTAQKREQSLLDVPLAISAIGGQEIEAAGINSMSDFYRRVPSLAVIDQGAARKNVIIRGIQTNTSTEASVTDVYLDEQRITSAIATGDPRTFDMQRVEVLRGPQGTLFGGGSLAGTVRYITNRADVSEFQANVSASLSSTKSAEGANYSFDGMVNIPLAQDKFAMRLVGYTQDDSGFLSNSLLGFDEVAGIESSGARIGFRFTPNERLAADFKYLIQDLKQNGFPEARGVDVGALDQSSATMTEERLTSKLQMYDLTWNFDFGIANLTSSTGYLQFDFLRRNDRSLPLIRNYFEDETLTSAQALAMAPPALRLYINDDNDNYTFSQEVRLTSNLDENDRFAWLVGSYYEDGEEAVAVGDFLLPGGGALTETANYQGAPADFFFREDFVTQLEQLAFFGELSYFIRPDLQATVGYRRSEFESYFSAYALIGDEPDDNGDVLVDELTVEPFKEKFNTFKFNLSYNLNEDLMLYAQSAEGFRLGFGSEVPPPLNPGCESFVTDFLAANGLSGFLVDGRLPGTKSDTLWVHEAGLKGTFGDGRGSFGVGYFYGDWKDILVEVEIDDITGQCNTGFEANAASATSTGVELEFNYAVSERLSLSGTGSYVSARLDKDEPFLGATANERLPGSPDLQISLSGDYVWPLSGGLLGFVRVDVQYIGEILGAFEFGDPRNKSGKYGLANVRAGVQMENYEWTLFVDNATGNRAKVFSNGLANEFRRTILLQPRTIGLQFRTKF